MNMPQELRSQIEKDMVVMYLISQGKPITQENYLQAAMWGATDPDEEIEISVKPSWFEMLPKTIN